MRRLEPSSHPAAEHVWLHRSQWRMVTALVLLLGIVVASLGLVAGYWWASRPRATAVAGSPPAAPPAVPPAVPVATEIFPRAEPAVVELYPAMVVRPPRPPVVVPSPGGRVAQIAVRIGQPVHAGEPLLRLEQPVPAPVTPHTPARATPHRLAANLKSEAAIRGRLEQLQSEIARARSAAASAPPAGSAGLPELPAVREADRRVRQAQQALVAATQRRVVVDERYRSHQASRFQFHLARCGELVAEVELRRAEEQASAARETSGAAQVSAEAAAAARAAAEEGRAERRVARLEAEAQRLQARLARVQERVAASRQQFAPPAPAPPRTGSVAVQAPYGGVIRAVWVRRGERVPRGLSLLAIAIPGRTLLRARVPRTALSSFAPGARVTLRRQDGHPLTGRVLRAWHEPDGSGAVEVASPSEARLGTGIALAPPHTRPGAPALPAAAVTRSHGQAAVWILARQTGSRGQWIAHRQAVRTEGAGHGQVRILSGLHPGDRVIVASAGMLRDGQPVAPVELGRLHGEE